MKTLDRKYAGKKEEAAEVTVERAAETEAGTAVKRAAEIDIFPARMDATLTVTVEAWSLERMNYIHTATQRGIYRVNRTLFATDAHMRTIRRLSAIAFSSMYYKEARRLANVNVNTNVKPICGTNQRSTHRKLTYATAVLIARAK